MKDNNDSEKRENGMNIRVVVEMKFTGWQVHRTEEWEREKED